MIEYLSLQEAPQSRFQNPESFLRELSFDHSLSPFHFNARVAHSHGSHSAQEVNAREDSSDVSSSALATELSAAKRKPYCGSAGLEWSIDRAPLEQEARRLQADEAVTDPSGCAK